MSRIQIGAALCILAAVVSACDDTHPCTLIGCTDNTSLRLESATWEQGQYDIDVSYDERNATCSIAVPVDQDADADAGVIRGEQTHCVSDGTALIRLEARRGLILTIEGLPAIVQVAVRRDDASLGAFTVRPTVTPWYPNGAGCGTCYKGAAVITIP